MTSLGHLNKVPQLWKGETVFILGGGPSLLDEDLSPIQGRRVIGVNDAFKLGSWVDISWSTDCEWLKWNEQPLIEFPGLIFSAPPCKCVHKKMIRIKRKHQDGLCADPSLVYWSKSSGASAINLAHHLGVSKIVLLGFDMKMRGDDHNWHANHQRHPRPTIYKDLFLKPFNQIALDAKSFNLEIFNATSDSDLNAFPRITLQEALQWQE
jgi:hypothetical protein